MLPVVALLGILAGILALGPPQGSGEGAGNQRPWPSSKRTEALLPAPSPGPVRPPLPPSHCSPPPPPPAMRPSSSFLRLGSSGREPGEGLRGC